MLPEQYCGVWTPPNTLCMPSNTCMTLYSATCVCVRLMCDASLFLFDCVRPGHTRGVSPIYDTSGNSSATALEECVVCQHGHGKAHQHTALQPGCRLLLCLVLCHLKVTTGLADRRTEVICVAAAAAQGSVGRCPFVWVSSVFCVVGFDRGVVCVLFCVPSGGWVGRAFPAAVLSS